MNLKNIYRHILVVGWLCLITSFSYSKDKTVSGKITDEYNDPMPGVNIIVQNTTIGTTSDIDGKYSINVPDNANVLIFSYVGYRTEELEVGNQTTIDLQMTADVTTLSELVVTGYTMERKADIIGSVSIVDTDELLTTPANDFTQQLQGRAAGVIVSGTGQPGKGSKVRIRGFTSFDNSDPLYVIDGVPTEDPSKINPQDIESLQVLKDATSASIYGARAAQGVIIITTKKGQPGKVRVSYDGYLGTQMIPDSYFPDLINTEGYVEYLSRTSDPNADPVFNHPVFGPASGFSIPDYIVNGSVLKAGFNSGDPEVNPDLYILGDYSDIYQILETSPGTNWFDEMTRTGVIQSHQLNVSGGTEESQYAIGFNYFNNKGPIRYTGYDRYAVRINTSFKPTDYMRIGENIQVIYEEFDGDANRGEGGAWAQSYRMVPYIPVYDIMGGWGGNGVGNSGNGTNPVAQLARNSDDLRNDYKIFGNVFAEVEPVKDLVLKTSFGIDYGNFFTKDIGYRTYERAENTDVTGLIQTQNYNVSWTWSNTLTYGRTFGKHATKILLGTEAVKYKTDGMVVNTSDFDYDDPDFINVSTDKSSSPIVNATDPVVSTLSSIFGRLDYTYNDRYLFNFTVRRDGSSKFSPDNKYGIFPAVGAGWRISEESFMDNVGWVDDLKIRGGWGQMGSERVVDALNLYSIFKFGVGFSNYDINRTQNTLQIGYSALRTGSDQTIWETTETKNIGLDASLFGGSWDIALDVYSTDTKDLLVRNPRNGLEPLVIQPFINLGKMNNKGFDFNITNRGTITGDLTYDATLTLSHYKNEVVDIDGNPNSFISRNVISNRLTDIVRTLPGNPISSFWGYQLDGFFQNQEDINDLEQEGAVIGGWRFKDQNGDNRITSQDQTVIGNPHPDFVMGINLGLQYHGFDFSAFFVWNKGNDLYNFTKYFTDMRVFVGGVSERVLNDSWTPEKPSGSLPYLANPTNSFTTGQSSDFYIEDGSFFRARTMQIGYTIPSNTTGKWGIDRVRFYVQGQNLFTITDYSGTDPDINILGDGDQGQGDLIMGVDQGGFPTPRQFLVGLNISL